MKSLKQKKHLEKLNSMPRSKNWCNNISSNKKKGEYLTCFCGNKFWVSPYRLDIAKYCSRICYGREKSSLVLGENNNNWRGGITKDNAIIRQSNEYKNWKEEIFERDNYTCQECGKRGGDLEAHHIKRFSLYSSLRFNIDNGKTLCVFCHRNTFVFHGNQYRYVTI